MGSTSGYVDGFSALVAKMGPRAPKKPQEAPKTAYKNDFGAILVDFWLIFWWFFGWFGGSFRLLLLVVLLVCCLVLRAQGTVAAGPKGSWIIIIFLFFTLMSV